MFNEYLSSNFLCKNKCENVRSRSIINNIWLTELAWESDNLLYTKYVFFSATVKYPTRI